MILDLREPARALRIDVPDLPGLRKPAIRTWMGRMVNEHGSAEVFDGLARDMERAGLDPAWVEECRTFATEERTHGVMCGAVVESLGGEALAEVADPEDYPHHADCSSLEAVLRNLLSICCLSETVAVSLIGAERLEMPEGPLRELLTRIWADEIGHSNFGWRMLPKLLALGEEGLEERLGRYLSVAFAHLEAHELSHLPDAVHWPEEGATLGLCNGSDAQHLFFDTVTEVIIPALESHGLPARAAWEARQESGWAPSPRG